MNKAPSLTTPRSPFGKRPATRSQDVRKLFTIHKGKCFYCGCTTHFWESQKHVAMPDNAPTVEHVFHRWDIRRAISEMKVLACRKCNDGKNKKDTADLWQGFTYYGNEFSIIESLKALQNE